MYIIIYNNIFVHNIVSFTKYERANFDLLRIICDDGKRIQISYVRKISHPSDYIFNLPLGYHISLNLQIFWYYIVSNRLISKYQGWWFCLHWYFLLKLVTFCLFVSPLASCIEEFSFVINYLTKKKILLSCIFQCIFVD